MPYYHVIISLKSRPHSGTFEENLLKQDLVKNIVEPYNKGESFKCGDCIVSQDDISYIKITKSEQTLSVPTYYVSAESYFADHWQAINQMKDVTDKFIKTLPQRKKETIKETRPISKNAFIVHGRDHKPMKELKDVLKDLSLNPIVLHELPSGSMTIIEKLEKYSEDVGFAFAILTPDDVGFRRSRFQSLLRTATFEFDHKKYFLEETIMHELKPRTRENVLLEFGYLIGKLSRNRVCCLYKGIVELPSDMSGIVYIAFQESVNEVRDKIVKELKAAGYEIKIK